MQLAKANTLTHSYWDRRKRRIEMQARPEKETAIDYAAGKRYYFIFLAAKVLLIEYAAAK